MSDPDQPYRRKSAILTAILQVVVLLIVFFMVAWREPVPPIPEYGIELNFGFEDTGSGDIQPEEESQIETEEEFQEQEETVADPITETTEAIVPEESIAEQIPTEDRTSPDVVKKEEIVAKPPPVVKPAVTEQKEVKSAASQGETATAGDQGNPVGEIDDRALYGSQGAADGPSLDMQGWKIAEINLPDDKSSEVGTIVFEIVVDADGFVISYKTEKSTVSPSVLNLYKRTVEDLVLERVSGSGTSGSARGKITFIIKSN